MTFTREGLFNKINPKNRISDLSNIGREEIKGYIRWYQDQVRETIKEDMLKLGYKASIIADIDSYMDVLNQFDTEVNLENFKKLQFEVHLHNKDGNVIMTFSSIPKDKEELIAKTKEELADEFLCEEQKQILTSLTEV